MRSAVLDASALICLIRREHGWERVAAFGVTSLVSAVNLVEVVYGLRKHDIPMEVIDGVIRPVIGRIVPFDDRHAYIAASVHSQTRERGVSLADCACLAVGIAENAVVVTADKTWATLGLDVKIVQIR